MQLKLLKLNLTPRLIDEGVKVMASLNKDVLTVELAEVHITCVYNGKLVFDETRFIRKPDIKEAEAIVRQWFAIPRLTRSHVVQCELVGKWRCSISTNSLYDHSFMKEQM